MYKYLRVYQLEWNNLTTFLRGFTFNLIMYPFQLLVVFFLWSFIFKVGSIDQLGNFTLELILIYFVIQRMVENALSSTDIAFDIEHDILGVGKTSLVIYLSSPIDYSFYRFSKSLAPVTLKTIISFTLLAIIASLWPSMGEILRIEQIIIFIFFFMIAIVQSFLIYTIIGYLTFWLKYAPSWYYYLLEKIVSGSLIPLSVFPSPYYKLLTLMPTAFIYYYPITTLMGIEKISLVILITGLFWIAILYIISKLLWKRGLSKFDAYGG